MKTSRLLTVVTYLLTLLAMFPVLTSGELPFVVSILVAVGGAGSLLVRGDTLLKGKRTAANVLIVLLLALLVGMSVLTGEWFVDAVIFALSMLVIKLFQKETVGDYYQITVLTFLVMLGGAVMNPSLTYALCFLLYVVLITWMLVMLHLKRVTERVGVETSTRRLVTGRFLVGTSALSLVIFAMSMVFFFIFPRLGFGFFFAKTRGSQKMAGFAPEVELGGFGLIKDNPAVVMRVELPELGPDEVPPLALRIKGMTFDKYDGKRWTKTLRGFKEITPANEGAYTLAVPVVPIGSKVIQDIYLEPLEIDTKVIFGIPQLASVTRKNTRIDALGPGNVEFFQDSSGDVSYTTKETMSIMYRATSLVPSLGPAVLDQVTGDVPLDVSMYYLQLPESLDPAIGALTESLTKDAATTYQKVSAVEAYLAEGFSYTLDLQESPVDDPLAGFILYTKAGHCEYFASAMAIMLRTVGVPTRIVNGFHGGAFNTVGRYFQMRQGDAHSWVEVYYPTIGWVTYDPTPAAHTMHMDEGFLSDIQYAIDYLRLSWYKWIVEYDLKKQWELFQEAAKLFDVDVSWSGGIDLDGSSLTELVKHNPIKTTLLALLLLLVVWRVTRRYRRGRQTREARKPARIQRIYGTMTRELAKRGLTRHEWETPRRFVARIRDHHPTAAEPAEVLTDLHDRTYYGGRPASGRELTDAKQTLRLLVERLRAPTSSPPHEDGSPP